MLYYESNDDLGLISKIYPNENIESALSNCTIIPEKPGDNYSCIYWRLKQEEINYFEGNEDLPLLYDIFCGVKEPMNVYVYKLDKTKYPVFKVKYFVSPKEKCLKDECVFILVSDIEGSISEFREGNSFYSLVNINNNDTNATDFLYCEIPKPSKIKNNYEISCYPYHDMENNTKS